MGASGSIPLDSGVNLTSEEIRLLRRFKSLDTDHSGSLTVDEILACIPELQNNPLVHRVIEVFDTDGNGEIDFAEFIQGISQFSVKNDEKQTLRNKLEFAFKIYDVDNDGFISNGELFKVLKMMIGSNLSDEQLQQVVDKTILWADGNSDDKLSFDEFCKVAASMDVQKMLTRREDI